MIFGIDVPHYTRITFETTFLLKLLIWLLFNSKQHPKLTIYCCQYDTWNLLSRLHQDNG